MSILSEQNVRSLDCHNMPLTLSGTALSKYFEFDLSHYACEDVAYVVSKNLRCLQTLTYFLYIFFRKIKINRSSKTE